MQCFLQHMHYTYTNETEWKHIGQYTPGLGTGQDKEGIPAHLENWLLVIFVTSVIAVDHSVLVQPVEFYEDV